MTIKYRVLIASIRQVAGAVLKSLLLGFMSVGGWLVYEGVQGEYTCKRVQLSLLPPETDKLLVLSQRAVRLQDLFDND